MANRLNGYPASEISKYQNGQSRPVREPFPAATCWVKGQWSETDKASVLEGRVESGAKDLPGKKLDRENEWCHREGEILWRRKLTWSGKTPDPNT